MGKQSQGDIEGELLIPRLYRRMANYQQCWRRCKSPACKRRQSCMGDAMECVTEGKPRVQLTPKEYADAMHDLRTRLKARIAEVQAEQSQGTGAQPPAEPKSVKRTKARPQPYAVKQRGTKPTADTSRS